VFPRKANLKESSQQSRPDVWEAHRPDVERLAKAVEEDGLPYSMAMGELLRSLHSISKTLSGKRASDDPFG
jgi:nitrate reductase assembly molybdenum cofactor insertion protein NarJ